MAKGNYLTTSDLLGSIARCLGVVSKVVFY